VDRIEIQVIQPDRNEKKTHSVRNSSRLRVAELNRFKPDRIVWISSRSDPPSSIPLLTHRCSSAFRCVTLPSGYLCVLTTGAMRKCVLRFSRRKKGSCRALPCLIDQPHRCGAQKEQLRRQVTREQLHSTI